MTHICVGNLTIIGSDNDLSPGRRQAITWTNVGILLIGPLGTNFSEMSIEIHTFSFKKIHLKMSSGKWRPFCLGLNVLTDDAAVTSIKYECNWMDLRSTFPASKIPLIEKLTNRNLSTSNQGSFSGTAAIIWFTQCHWNNPEEYG